MNLFMFLIWVAIAVAQSYLWWDNKDRFQPRRTVLSALIVIGALLLAASRLGKIL